MTIYIHIFKFMADLERNFPKQVVEDIRVCFGAILTEIILKNCQN